MILGQLRMGARQAKNAPLVETNMSYGKSPAKSKTLFQSFFFYTTFFSNNLSLFLSRAVGRLEVAACPNILQPEKIPSFVFSPSTGLLNLEGS